MFFFSLLKKNKEFYAQLFPKKKDVNENFYEK